MMKLVHEPVSVVLKSLNPKSRYAPEPKRSGDLPPRKPLEDEPAAEAPPLQPADVPTDKPLSSEERGAPEAAAE